MIIYVPKETAIVPANGECLVGHWWIVHPEHGLAFYVPSLGGLHEPMPQCNADKAVTDMVLQKLYPDCVVEQLPVVYAAHVGKVRHKLIEAARNAQG